MAFDQILEKLKKLIAHEQSARDIEIDFFAEWQQYQREADLRVAAQLRKIIRAVN
jgi:hypothetical protein